MQTKNKTLLCQYQYDPLDRLVDSTYSGEEGARRFYQKDRLATETDGFVHRSIIQHEDQLLAQQQRQTDAVETSLLATDQQRSVLNVLAESGPHPIAHTPYGHRPLASGLLSLLGFNGERPDPVTGCYLLGNGYRAFNPVLMRFNSPDSWSPFGKGGLNAYAYCAGDPVNRIELDGHSFTFMGALKYVSRKAGLRTSNRATKSGIQNGPIENARVLAPGIAHFDTVHNNSRQLNIEAHGTKPSLFNTASIVSNNTQLNPKQLLAQLESNNIKIGDYDNIHLIICYSGDGGGGSFAGKLAKITNKPVDSYLGPAKISRSRSPLKEYETRQLTGAAPNTLNETLTGKDFASTLSKIGISIRYNP